MTREEQIEQKAKELGQKYFPDEHNIWARPNYEAQYVEYACKEMMEWADAHPKDNPLEGILIHGNNDAYKQGYKDAFDKACEFLKSYRQETPDGIGYIAGIVNDETIEDFRKYMEEQQ